MKVKSVSDLAFQALDQLTDNDDELWVAHAIFDREASRTGEIQKIMSDDCGLSYYAVQRVLQNLVDKGIIFRVRRGKYAPNLKLVLEHMLIECERESK
ncbi:hypothetical protein LCGC14_2067950 [marine sediment metagenome]|uniref:HTH marR-type domain-containing protein n=1 Tax=marine sediment metagenome TaxID=412755 RepID=A0A0F9EJE0_9ZZZZ